MHTRLAPSSQLLIHKSRSDVEMSNAAKDPISLGSTAYRKHFIPLESNPVVFTELIHRLGIPRSLEFQDVLSLDDPDLLGFLPRPAYALILVFPTTEAYETRIKEKIAGSSPTDLTRLKAMYSSSSRLSITPVVCTRSCTLLATGKQGARYVRMPRNLRKLRLMRRSEAFGP